MLPIHFYASAVWVPSHAEEIAEALAEKLAKITPRAADDEEAQLAPFVDPNVAARISQIIDQGLQQEGARDVSAGHRRGERLSVWNDCSYLLPTIIHCTDLDHPLAGKEFLFPYAAVVQVPQSEVTARLTPSLVVTAITRDKGFAQDLIASPNVDRLNLGPVATNHVSWDQPHEGNLFDHLYARRAFQRAASF